MAKSKETGRRDSEGKSERLWRFARNVNALGAAALIGAGVLIPPIAPVALALGTLNAGQAGAFEVMRQRAKKSRKKNRS
ncbi:MAG: hypothetical protein V4702_02705 [Patescibacteria group bacterium]